MAPGAHMEVGRAGTAGTSERSKDMQVNTGGEHMSLSKIIKNI